MKSEEKTVVETPTVCCADDHPAVYLTMDENGEAVCPYCSHQFVLSNNAKSPGGH